MAGLFGFMSDIFGESSNAGVYRDSDEVNTERTLKTENDEATLTGVAKYLKTKKHSMPSGVAKYLAKQNIASKQKCEAEISKETIRTGVEKYLQTHEKKPQVKMSGVAQYLASHDHNPASGVAKYVARKIIAARNAPPILKTTGVTLYLENRKQVLATGVSKYIARQVLAAKQLMAETAEAVESATRMETSLTGVEKYLQTKG